MSRILRLPNCLVVLKKTRGDADCNNSIDNLDFEIWRKEKFQELTTKTADFNSDSVVDLIDFEIWRKNRFPTTTPTPTIPSTPTIVISPTISPQGKGIWISKKDEKLNVVRNTPIVDDLIKLWSKSGWGPKS